MKAVFAILALVIGLAFAAPSFAVDVTISGTEVNFSYKEPSTNTDGTPLNDLSKVSIFYKVNNGAEVKAHDEVATAKTGGGTKTIKFIVPINETIVSTIQFWAVAYDEAGNASPNSQVLIKQIDKLAPASPQ